MSLNRLKLNADKAQFIVLGSRLQLSNVKCDRICLGGLDIQFLQKVTCLGIILNTELSMVQHVHAVISLFYQLRQIRAICKSLYAETSTLLVHAFINSRLDYCNSARVVTRKRKYDSITSTLRVDLHWLPVVSRIHFKQCMLVYMSLHGSAPVYIAEMCIQRSFDSEHYQLRSAVYGELVVLLEKK